MPPARLLWLTNTQAHLWLHHTFPASALANHQRRIHVSAPALFCLSLLSSLASFVSQHIARRASLASLPNRVTSAGGRIAQVLPLTTEPMSLE